MRLVALSLVSLIALAGCGSNEALSPVDAGADAGDGGTEPPDAGDHDAGPVRRTILTRDPFGKDPDNLFIDGDFELSTQGNTGQQLGWRSFDTTGTQEFVTKTETGGPCRSGLRCAIFESGELMLVRGAAASLGRPMTASVWAKTSLCASINPIAIACDTSAILASLKSDTHPGADGYCSYKAKIPTQQMSICLYLENSLSEFSTALVDEALLLPDDGTSTDLAEVIEVKPATLSRIQRLMAFVHGSMRVGPTRRVHQRNPR